MSGKNQHVVPYNGDWAIRGAGNSKVTAVYDTQQEAYDAGRQIARNQGAELFTHGRNGQIRARESYGNESKVIDREH